APGGPGTVSVLASNTCSWKAYTETDWVTVESPGTRIGNGTVNYTVAPNPNPQLRGTIMFAGGVFALRQTADACAYSVTGAPTQYPAFGGTGTITISTSAGCAWTASAAVPWITITSPASGFGTGK